MEYIFNIYEFNNIIKFLYYNNTPLQQINLKR